MRRRELFFKRNQRQKPPLPRDEVEIPRYPPEPGKPQKMSALMLIAPSFTMFIMAAGMAFLYQNYLYPIIMVMVGVTFFLVNVFRQREREKRHEVELERVQSAYDNYLGEVKNGLDERIQQQANYLTTVYPDAEEIGSWVGDETSRLWERVPNDDDFMDLRLGRGQVPASFGIKLQKVDIPELAPPHLLEANEMASQYQSLPDMPITASLIENHTMAIIAPPNLREGLARTLLCQIAGLHAPGDVELYAVYPSNKIDRWEWLKWLPHCQTIQSGGTIRNLGYEAETIREVYSGLLDILDETELKPQDKTTLRVLLVADPDLIHGETILRRILDRGRDLNTALILLTPNPQEVPEGFKARITITNERTATLQEDVGGRSQPFVPEFSTVELAENLARDLAPLQLADRQSASSLPDEIRLLDLIGSSEIEHIELESRWIEALSHPPSLLVPLGMRHGNRPLLVDLKQSGVGPHGLIAGTTGSGKSELLLTLLMSIALNHHPHQVNFVLIDYKGGTAMNVLKGLPHTVGLVTDLDGKQTRRALVALGSEMERREAILAHHQVADIDKYHQLGIAEPFPYLFIVIDEFAELRDRFRDDLAQILGEFVSVAQKGRALGVHLILAMQKPEGVVNDSIRANMKFRICLRVERSEDSRNVLGRPDAYLLPHQPPGRAYFQVGKDEQFDLFQVARIAGYPHSKADGNRKKPPLIIHEVGPDGRRIPVFELTPPAIEVGKSQGIAQTEAQLLVEKANFTAEKMQIEKMDSPWPPPLSERIPLDELFTQMQEPKWEENAWPEEGIWRGAPVGLLDEPIEQRQRPLLLNPLEHGNILVVGAPGSGRTNFLLTYATSMMLSMSPEWVHLHLIDFGGHQLNAGLAKFPHVAGVYERAEINRIRRLLSTLISELEDRKKAFSTSAAVNLGGYHRANPDAPVMPMVLTMINNFSGFSEAFQDELVGWNRLLREGGSYGLHFVLTSDRIPQTRTADLIPTRIALRLTDRSWYSLILGMRPELTTYNPHPGRGFLNAKPPTELQIAIPMDASSGEQIAGLQEIGKRMSEVWTGPRPTPVRVLGDRVPLVEVLPERVLEEWPLRADLQTWIGLNETDLQPTLLDLNNIGTSLLIVGPPGSGKSTTLTTIALSLAATHSPEQVQLGFVSFRRGKHSQLDALTDLPHCIGLAKSMGKFESLLSDIEEIIDDSLANGARDTSEGPQLTLLFIDDYPLISGRAEPALLGRLEGLVQRGAQAGITVIIAVPVQALSGVGDGVLRRFKSMRTGIWLKSTDRMDAASVGVSIPALLRGVELPPGRGFFYHPGGQSKLQIPFAQIEPSKRSAVAGKPISIADWVSAIRGVASKSG
jgi:S-DNA-T family DNA segregation ATPase FtsK/SpoIIIE